MKIFIGRVKSTYENKVIDFYVHNMIEEAKAYPLFTLREPKEDDEVVVFSVNEEFHCTFLYLMLGYDNEDIDLNIMGLHLKIDGTTKQVSICNDEGLPTSAEAVPDASTSMRKGIFCASPVDTYTGLPIRSNTFIY